MINFRLIAVVPLLTILATSVYADESARFNLPSGVRVRIIEAPFVKSDFKVEGCTGHEPECKINGRIPYGTDLDLPNTFVKTIEISFGGRTHVLNSNNMYNAWGKRPLEYKGSIRYFGGKCFDGTNCQLRGVFSDGAGTFVAEWKVINGVSTRTVLTDSNDVVGLFIEHIDPPEFE